MLHGLVEQLFHAKLKQKDCHVVVDGSGACSLCVQLAAWALHMLGDCRVHFSGSSRPGSFHGVHCLYLYRIRKKSMAYWDGGSDA